MSHMYSKSKINQIHNLMDARWKTEEKISQYRGLLKIFGRERKKEINEANKVRRQQAIQVQELRKDCAYYRQTLGDSEYGNKQRLRNALQPNRSIQVTYQRLWPARALEYFEHVNTKKQKELDLLRYRKSKRMELFTHLKLEKAELHDRLEIGFENINFRRIVQVLTNRIEMFVVRQNAAAHVCKLYKNMIKLLHNDANFFDAILVVLYSVCNEQCRCILQAVELGQLAQEDLNDIREEYYWLEREVKVNIKERDREVKQIKKAAEDLLTRCRLLTRAESYAYVYKTSDTQTADSTDSRTNEADELELIMKKVQEATLSSTYFDIFPRMLDQLEQEETLMKQMKKMMECRDRVMHMKHHSEMLLSTLTHTVTTSTVRYNESKEKLEKELEDEKYRLKREKETIEEFGEMLAKLKIALQALFETLHRLKEIPVVERMESSSEEVVIIEEWTPQQIEESFPPPIEKNPKMLIQKVADTLALFHIYAYETLDDETLQRARVIHQNDVLYARAFSAPPVEYDLPLLEERETEDAAVLSRAQIKLQSKQMVEEHQRLVMLAEMGPAALAKMRRRM